MAGLGVPELLVGFLIVLVLFGYKRLPDAARALGRSLRIWRTELHADDQERPAVT